MKAKPKVNTEALNEFMSPSRTILKPKVPNSVHKGTPLMSEEEFDLIMNNEQYMVLPHFRRYENLGKEYNR